MVMPKRDLHVDQLRTVREACERLDVAERTMRKWIADRRIAIVRLGGRYVRIPEKEIERVLEARATVCLIKQVGAGTFRVVAKKRTTRTARGAQ